MGEGTLPEAFTRMARRMGDREAVTDTTTTLSYAALDARSDRLAAVLTATAGIRRGDRVGLYAGRSVDLVVGILGILKAGAAYVPLDPAYPVERLRFLAADAQLAAIVAAGTAPPTDLGDHPVVPIDGSVPASDARPPDQVVTPTDLAYLVYTSGSTGLPKGVMVEHRHVTALLAAADTVFDFGTADVWTLFHSYAFDFSVWELFGALLHGSRLVVVPRDVAQSPERMWDLVTRHGVTVLNQTPSYFQQMMAADASRNGIAHRLRYVVFGGEALPYDSLRRWYERHGRTGPTLVNMYGITETTVHVAARPVSAADAGPRSVIGEPLPHVSWRLLDDDLHAVPPGRPGEIWVGGSGVTRGYWRRPALTAERFQPDPDGPPGSRRYRSGDLAVVGADGQWEYRGRADDQVKIRGFRIEPAEVEACLREHPGIGQVAVVAEADPYDRLVAYVVPHGVTPATADLRAHVARTLPAHLVPARFVPVAALPLTVNGKLDRGALAALPSPAGPVAPPTASPVEQMLHEIWCEILDLEAVGLDDDFFTVGGNSMVAIRVAAACAARGARFDLGDLLRGRTIRALAQQVAVTAREPAATAPFSLLTPEDRLRLPDDVVDAYPLTALQLGMLYHAEGSDTNSYHSVSSAVVNASFDGDRMRRCLAELIARHEVLRTSFDLHSCDVPVALVHRHATAELTIAVHSGMSAAAQRDAARAAWAAERDRKVDWRAAPMIRFAATVLRPDAFRLTWCEHHAVLDGWSSASLFAEIVARYTDTSNDLTATRPLPPFRDYVAAELAARSSPQARAFWTGYLAGPAPRGLTPGGQPGDRRVMSLQLPVSTEVAGRLRQIARDAAVPLKSLLLAVHAVTLGGWAGAAEEVVVGQVAHGRLEAPGGDRALGLFLNTVPLRVPARRGSSSWLELAKEAAVAEQEMQPYRRYPLSDIQRAAPHRPPVDNLFHVTDFDVQDQLVQSDVVAAEGFRNASDTHFPLAVEVAAAPGTGEFSVLLQGRRDHWHERDLTTFGEALLDGLAAVAAAPDQPPPPQHHPPAALPTGSVPPTGSAPPAGATVCDWIAATVRRQPDRIAVTIGDDALSYQQLWLRAGAVAAALRGTAGTVVAVLVPRTPDLVVALLGVLRAGAVLLPIDPEQPALRIAQLLDDAGATAVVGDQATLRHAAGRRAVDVTTVETDDSTTPQVRGGDLAYVLYTSGSTGTPKGVAVEHRAVAAITDAVISRLGLSADDVVLGWTTVAFDIALVELLFALVAGARVELVTQREADDPVRVARRIVDGGVTVVQSTPSRLAVLVEAGWRGAAMVVSAGEPLAPTLAHDLRAAGCTVWNGYGPTEATIYATMHRVTGEESGSVPIGRPLPGVDVRIVDERGADVAPGADGELLIGGVGVARGYLGRPALTADRFQAAAAGARQYATGDIVRSRPDGVLEYRGRRDHQVKLHGVRIELAEVEAVMAGHPAVAQAVAALATEDGRTQLVAHVQPAADIDGAGAGPVDIDALRRYLGERLPRAMVPSRFHVHTAFPLMVNGKVDRRRLSTGDATVPPGGSSEGTGSAAPDPPREPWEALVATTWQQLLGVPVVRRQDNFFALGGDSLQVVRLIGRLSNHGVSLDIADVLDNPTVDRLAAVLAGAADRR